MAYRELPETVKALEEEVLRCWDEEDTFHRSLASREAEPEFVFYEGPPTANGRPGVHHIMARTIKDLVGRFKTMTGHHVTRIAGWDTHGLPVEIEAEKELGISGKPEIEEVGIGEFNRVCRENIFTYKEEWERLSTRIGYWLDYDRAYVTCTPDYVESCWWALKEIDRMGLLYKGYRVAPYCPRCGTGLSSHEVAQGYADVVDTAVYVKFHLEDDPDGARILSWTTTPWTLPGNLALAVGPEIDYAKVRIREESASGAHGTPGEVLILATERMEETLRHHVEVLEEMKGAELVGRRYRTLFPGAVDVAGSDAPGADGAWTVVAGDFVSTEEGTGVVHTAVMYGEEDFELGEELGLPMQHTVDPDGRFVEEVPGDLAGRYVKAPETEDRILAYLREGDLLYREESHRHSYPHCWRCDSPLLYMAMDSWYIETTAVKDRLLENNAGVDWHPPEIGTGRMGEWLENNVDWALSRDRYWGTPLPIWECERDPEHRRVLGSLAELAEAAGGLPEGFDPHRPEIDEIGWPCDVEGCDGRMRRVPQVADAWYDSGSMPYAQWHYPFENEDEFERHFPADFIAEGVDQTRGWFYSLLALSTLLFDRSAYRSVVVNDLILDAEGQKMSKSRGNVVDPWTAIGAHGADAIRYYLLSSSNPWIPKRWDPEGIREADRKLLDTLRNTYRFFALYANLEGWRHAPGGRTGASGQPDKGGANGETGETTAGAPRGEARPWRERSAIDRWLLGRLDVLGGAVRDDLESYDLTRGARRIGSFVLDDLSNWYVRRSRDRFWATGPADERPELHGETQGGATAAQDTVDAFATLHEALVTTTRLLAPYAPFLPDWLHRELTEEGSVHLADFPVDGGRRDPDLEREMADVRRLATLGRAARDRVGLRVRQPLRRLRAVVPGGRIPSPALVEILREELNVKEVHFLGASDEITRLSVKPDFAALGPTFGAETPKVAEAIRSLEADQEKARALQAGEEVPLEVGGKRVTVGPEQVKLQEEAVGGTTVESEAGYLVALDTELDDELVREGIARELVNRIQRLRRDAGLAVSDRIRLGIAGGERVRTAARAHREYIAGETLARQVVVWDREGAAAEPDSQAERDSAAGPNWVGAHREDAEVDGERVTLALVLV